MGYQTYCESDHAVAQLIEALNYKSEVRGFDSRLCHGNFLLTSSFRPHDDRELIVL